MLLPFRDHTYFRLISTRTDETMFEAEDAARLPARTDGSVRPFGIDPS